MKIRKPDYFDKFKCIASKCEDTCCAGWGIVIDDKSYKYYLSVEGKFGEELRSKIIREDGENIFQLKGNRCSFLNNDNLCDIYNNLGQEALCHTCKQYPRFSEEFGSLREIGISLSCPEAARIILGQTSKTEFKLSDNEEEVNNYNDINAMLYINLLQCRKIVLDLLQDRNLDIKIRAALSLVFINEIQEQIDKNNINGIKSIKDKYLNKSLINKIINSFAVYERKEDKKYIYIKELFKIFKDELEHITYDSLSLEKGLQYFWQSKEDKEVYLKINTDFNNYYKEENYQFEHILVYFTYKYFLKAVFDYDLIGKMKISIVSTIMIKELCAIRFFENKEFTFKDLVDIAHTYSKDIEHSEENVEKLQELFETNKNFTIDKLLTVLLN